MKPLKGGGRFANRGRVRWFATIEQFNTWAANPTGVPDLIKDLHRWATQVGANTTT